MASSIKVSGSIAKWRDSVSSRGPTASSIGDNFPGIGSMVKESIGTEMVEFTSVDGTKGNNMERVNL